MLSTFQYEVLSNQLCDDIMATQKVQSDLGK